MLNKWYKISSIQETTALNPYEIEEIKIESNNYRCKRNPNNMYLYS